MGNSLSKISVSFFIVIAIVMFGAFAAAAQISSQVQELDGVISQPDEAQGVFLEGLEEGRTLYVYVEATSGNLDPFIGLLAGDFQPGSLASQFYAEVDQAIAENRDPLLVVEEFSDQNFLAWDDDSGEGFSAAFEYEIPADGDYLLVVIGSPFSESSGNFRLLVGLDAPQVLTGSASVSGDPFARPTSTFERRDVAIQEIHGSLESDAAPTIYRLEPFRAEDTLYVYAETVLGDLVPQLTLRAYASKPLRSANIGGGEQQAHLQYTYPAADSNYQLEVAALPGTTGDYRLLIGRNAPSVLSGQGTPEGGSIVKEPIEVEVGVKLQQIANIDQKAERYDAVVTLVMGWTDPALAFRSDECRCEFQTYTAKDFIAYTTREGIYWPAFTYLNQQNNRWIQNDYVVVYPDGRALYFERFTTTFQAPDFDFHQFPFDTQQFFIRVQSLYGSSFFTFTPSDFTEVGTQLGEEEWYITDYETEIVEETSSIGNQTSNFIFRFFAKRHLSFYIFRIFLPLILIITVAWITFFLEDYGKRIDATIGNLLLFIAYNFTIANDLPRLGYLTYLDFLLASTFFVSVLIVAYNVYLKRQEKYGKDNWAQRIDKYMIWLYPLGYFVAFGLVTWYFFR